jgi:hypothetical protein
MMQSVKAAVGDADVYLLVTDVYENEPLEETILRRLQVREHLGLSATGA